MPHPSCASVRRFEQRGWASCSIPIGRWPNCYRVQDQTGPHAGHLIGGDAGTDPDAVDGHAAIDLAASDGTGHGRDPVRVVIFRRHLQVAEVDGFESGIAQFYCQASLQVMTSKVGGEPNSFRWVIQ